MIVLCVCVLRVGPRGEAVGIQGAQVEVSTHPGLASLFLPKERIGTLKMPASSISKSETVPAHNDHPTRHSATDSSEPGSKSTATTSGKEGARAEGSAAGDSGARNAKKRSASSVVEDIDHSPPHKILATSSAAREDAQTTPALPKPPLPVLESDLKAEAQEADPNGPMFGRPEKGKLRFFAICNDGSMQNMVWLLQLKQIFSRQLPKMPAQYITRLIFDPHHISLCLFKDLEPIGGISYRPFYEQEYAWLGFVHCCVYDCETCWKEAIVKCCPVFISRCLPNLAKWQVCGDCFLRCDCSPADQGIWNVNDESP